VLDERVKEVTVYDVSPQAVRRVWEAVNKDGDEAARHALDALDMFVTRRIHDRKALDHLSDQKALEMAEGSGHSRLRAPAATSPRTSMRWGDRREGPRLKGAIASVCRAVGNEHTVHQEDK
jgi:hypothetical protein